MTRAPYFYNKREQEGRGVSVNSIKCDYEQTVGIIRDEYTTAQLELRSLSPNASEYSALSARVDGLRDTLIARSVAFICEASRMDPPFMWSAFHLSMLDAAKNEYNRWGDAIGDTIMRYMVRAFAWDRKPIDADNTLFTCNDFHKYINLSSYLDARRTFTPGLHTIVKLLKMRGGMAARNADTIIRHTVTAAAQTGDDPNMCRYLQLSGHFSWSQHIEEYIFSNPSEQANIQALLARIYLRSVAAISTSLCPAIETADTEQLSEAAKQCRNEITARVLDGNTLWESDARIAHTLVCCELANRNHIATSDLAELIETMNGKRTFRDLTLNTPYGRQHVYETETLIDAVSAHMTF